MRKNMEDHQYSHTKLMTLIETGKQRCHKLGKNAYIIIYYRKCLLDLDKLIEKETMIDVLDSRFHELQNFSSGGMRISNCATNQCR